MVNVQNETKLFRENVKQGDLICSFLLFVPLFFFFLYFINSIFIVKYKNYKIKSWEGESIKCYTIHDGEYASYDDI